VRQAFEPSIRRAFHLYWRWARGVTLGVRGLAGDLAAPSSSGLGARSAYLL